MRVPNLEDELTADGSALQCLNPPELGALPTTIAGSAAWTSNLIASGGMTKVSVGAKLTGNCTVQVQRFVDAAGVLPQTAVAATTIAGGAAGVANVGGDGLPFASFKVVVTDTSAGTNTVTNLAILANSK